MEESTAVIHSKDPVAEKLCKHLRPDLGGSNLVKCNNSRQERISEIRLVCGDQRQNTCVHAVGGGGAGARKYSDFSTDPSVRDTYMNLLMKCFFGALKP